MTYITKWCLRFAQANGWYRAEREFTFGALASGKKGNAGPWRGDGWDVRRPLDHPEWFRAGGRPAAIVGHNYPNAREDELTRVGEQFGLKLHLHVAPAPRRAGTTPRPRS
jgi:hypothetical protein